MKKPDEVGRQGFYEAIVRTYTYLYPGADHALHNGPEYGCVARELHCQSPLECRRKAHFHCASAFAVEHKWKAVERYLREKEKIKVKSAPSPAWGQGCRLASLQPSLHPSLHLSVQCSLQPDKCNVFLRPGDTSCIKSNGVYEQQSISHI